MTRLRFLFAFLLIGWALWALALILNGTDEVRW